MNASLDDVTMEQSIAWLDALESIDPESYKQIIDTMQRQLQTAELGEDISVCTPQGGTDTYDSIETSASDQKVPGDRRRSRELKLRWFGDKMMGKDGVKATQEGVFIDVKPGFVMMTNETTNKKKVFVNVVCANEIQPFSEQAKLDDKGKEQEKICVPLSLVAPREVKDKRNVSSLVFDVVVNTKVVEDCQVDRTGTYRNFVCELAIDFIDHKYKIKLDGRYELPRLAYHGKLPPPKHYIRKVQAPIIQEVLTKSSTASKKTCTSGFAAQKVPQAANVVRETATARYEIYEERKGDRVVCQRLPSVVKGSIPLSPAVLELAGDRLVVSVKFEHNVRAATGVELELHAELLSVKIAAHHDLEIYLPYPVDQKSAKCCFDQGCNTLDIILTIDKFWDTLGPDSGSASWLLDQAVAKENVSPTSKAAMATNSNTEKKPKNLVEMFQLANTEPSIDRNGLVVQRNRHWNPVIEDEKLPKDHCHRTVVMPRHIVKQRPVERQHEANQFELKLTQRRAEVEERLKRTQVTEKPCREMHPNETEAIVGCINVKDIVQQEKSRLDRYQQQQNDEIDFENAKRAVAKWAEHNRFNNLDLQSALAFNVY